MTIQNMQPFGWGPVSHKDQDTNQQVNLEQLLYVEHISFSTTYVQ